MEKPNTLKMTVYSPAILILIAVLPSGSLSEGSSRFQQLETDWRALEGKDIHCKTLQMRESVLKHLSECRSPTDEKVKTTCSEAEAALLHTVIQCKKDEELSEKCKTVEQSPSKELIGDCAELIKRQYQSFDHVFSPCKDLVDGANIKYICEKCKYPQSKEEEVLCLNSIADVRPIVNVCWKILNFDLPKGVSSLDDEKHMCSSSIRPWADKGYVSCVARYKHMCNTLEKHIEGCRSPDGQEQEYTCKQYFYFKDKTFERKIKRVEVDCKSFEKYIQDFSGSVEDVMEHLRKITTKVELEFQKCASKEEDIYTMATEVCKDYGNEKDENQKDAYKTKALDALRGLQACVEKHNESTQGSEE